MPPLTPSATRALLDELGHRPVRKLGQNFLIDPNIVRKSLELADLGPGEMVVEVGPGLGTLTGALLGAGARVFAVEYDRRLHAHLEGSFAEARQAGQLHLMHGDAVEHPRAGYAGPEPFSVVANLPYAITTPWLEGILEGPLPRRLVLMLQQEAADRLTAAPGTKSFGAIAVFLQGAFAESARHRVAATCFYPAPEVGSLLLRLDRRPEPRLYAVSTRAAIRQVFTQRRKQLGSLVRGHPLLEGWLAQAADLGVRATDRAEDVPLGAWELLCQARQPLP